MKINKLYLSLLAVAALSACTADDDSAQQTIDIDDSPVEVRLSAGSGSKTRASVESDANGLFEVEGLGIFMLAVEKQGTNPVAWDITWATAAEAGEDPYHPDCGYANWAAVQLNNVEANAVAGDNQGTPCTDIEWADGESKFYPFGNWYNYRFYGYYPIVSSEQLTQTASQRLVTYTHLDGTKDIIWGQSKLGSNNNEDDNYDQFNAYRYSARYFRQANNSNNLPELGFQHKLMRMKFFIEGLADATGKFDAANNMVVESIVVEKVPQTAYLVVADMNGTDDGKISFEDWTDDVADLTVSLKEAETDRQVEEDNASLVRNRKEVTQDAILLPVPDEAAAAVNYKYRLLITLKDTSLNQVFSHEMPIDLNMSNVDLVYEKGKSYNVIIKIGGPTEVSLRASLKAWDEDDESIVPLELF